MQGDWLIFSKIQLFNDIIDTGKFTIIDSSFGVFFVSKKIDDQDIIFHHFHL